MRKTLLLALLLYDIVAFGTRPNNYDYEETAGNKRQSFDERRNWRKKALQRSFDSHKEWDKTRRYDNYNPKYAEDIDIKSTGADREREIDNPGYMYKNERSYDNFSKMKLPSNIRSAELEHAPPYLDKNGPRKSLMLNCQRQHERFEACFAGCAAVTCDNPRDRLRPCYPFCEPGCVCAQPYVRDDRTHKCVLPEDCSKGLKGIPDLGEDV